MPDTFGTVYAGLHGIEGVLKEELINLSAQPAEEIALLSTTAQLARAVTNSRHTKPKILSG